MSRGPLHLCTTSCAAALNAVADAAYLCTKAELDSYLGAGARKALDDAQEAQVRCSPPSVQCMLTYTKLKRWEWSDVGRQCMANIAAIFESTDSKSVQKHNQVYCESKACGGAMSGYLARLEAQGCGQWTAYKTKRMEYDRTCLVTDVSASPIKESLKIKTYCASIASPAKYVHARARACACACACACVRAWPVCVATRLSRRGRGRGRNEGLRARRVCAGRWPRV